MECTRCKSKFASKYSLQRHMRNVHKPDGSSTQEMDNDYIIWKLLTLEVMNEMGLKKASDVQDNYDEFVKKLLVKVREARCKMELLEANYEYQVLRFLELRYSGQGCTDDETMNLVILKSNVLIKEIINKLTLYLNEICKPM